MIELYLVFFSHVLQYFTQINQLLQREEPIIGIAYKQVNEVYTCIFSLICKPILTYTCMHNMHGIIIVDSKVPAVVDVQVCERYIAEGCEFMRRTVSKQGQPVGRCMSCILINNYYVCVLLTRCQASDRLSHSAKEQVSS